MQGNTLKRRKRVIVCVKGTLSSLARDLTIDPCDLSYVIKRLHSEGLAFVTKTLPAFSKYAISCCSEERLLDATKCGLTHFELKGRAPRFMRGLLLEAIGGCATALFRIRQFCEYWYKAAFSFSDEQLEKAARKYQATDNEYDREKICWITVEKIRKNFETGFPRLSSSTVSDALCSVRPHDGPGAFARSGHLCAVHRTSIGGFKRLPSSTIGLCPTDARAFAGYFRSYPSSPEEVVLVSETKTAEILFVPKDSRGPRTISKEPYFLLKGQMSIGKFIASSLERESRGSVNFTDQGVNQRVAQSSSTSQEYATLDLQEASDRIWLPVVRHITRNCPSIRWAIRHLRSTHARLPDGNVCKLNKLANMGSGLCFPLLSLVVYLAAVTALTENHHYSLKEAMRTVKCYGDDLEVPTRTVESVISTLSKIGLVVNRDKSFWKGYFRESCGADFYHGIDVAPIRFRLSNAGLGFPSDYRNGFIPIPTDSGINQISGHYRELACKGLVTTAKLFYNQLRRRFGDLPNVSIDSPYIGGVLNERPDTFMPEKVYQAVTVHKIEARACSYKGIGRSLASRDGLMHDWSLVPERRQVVFKRRVPSRAVQQSWGLPYVPDFITK